jgi:hypothetical protein
MACDPQMKELKRGKANKKDSSYTQIRGKAND